MPQSDQVSVPQLVRLCSRVCEPQLLGPHAAAPAARAPWSPCSAADEATTMRSLCAATRERTHSNKDPVQPKNK